jgi:hypothetical protein
MVILNGFVSYKTFSMISYYESINPSAKLSDTVVNPIAVKLWGIYIDKQYYCVWTGNQTEAQINYTDNHERCHHLVAMDYSHFCTE